MCFCICVLGADDTVGPNYTGQAVVDSYYEKDDVRPKDRLHVGSRRISCGGPHRENVRGSIGYAAVVGGRIPYNHY